MSALRTAAAGGEPGEAPRRSPLLGEIDQVLRNVKLTLVVLAVIVSLFILAPGCVPSAQRGLNPLPPAVFFAVVFAGGLAVGFYQEERRRFSEGLIAPAESASVARPRRFLVPFAILVFSVLLSLFAAGDRPFINLSSLIQQGNPRVIPRASPPPGDAFAAFTQFAKNLNGVKGGPSSQFTAALNVVLLALLCGLIALFLVSPLFSRRFRDALKAWRPGLAVRRLIRRLGGWAGRLAAAVGAFFSRLFARAEPSRIGTARGGDAAGGKGARGAAGVRGERETNRVIRLFRRLMRWAADRNLAYRRGQTAFEYVASIAVRFPAEQERLRLVLETFERALFSGRSVGREELRRYGESIREVTRLR